MLWDGIFHGFLVDGKPFSKSGPKNIFPNNGHSKNIFLANGSSKKSAAEVPHPGVAQKHLHRIQAPRQSTLASEVQKRAPHRHGPRRSSTSRRSAATCAAAGRRQQLLPGRQSTRGGRRGLGQGWAAHGPLFENNKKQSTSKRLCLVFAICCCFLVGQERLCT